ncbi:hypothetical protein [Vibrio sp. B516a]|uniref:hypothetical protein n=1 Tax=Vibrio sp. B516a TaxID=2836348 RepID=UPI0025567467|nr:hypothetical protein [Vibrio sp. B516a]MDK9744813.1 hypothetical protein [Vibrio sp. B516a]
MVARTTQKPGEESLFHKGWSDLRDLGETINGIFRPTEKKISISLPNLLLGKILYDMAIKTAKGELPPISSAEVLEIKDDLNKRFANGGAYLVYKSPFYRFRKSNLLLKIIEGDEYTGPRLLPAEENSGKNEIMKYYLGRPIRFDEMFSYLNCSEFESQINPEKNILLQRDFELENELNCNWSVIVKNKQHPDAQNLHVSVTLYDTADSKTPLWINRKAKQRICPIPVKIFTRDWFLEKVVKNVVLWTIFTLILAVIPYF